MKLSAAAARFAPLLPILRCPLCGHAFALQNERSLLCGQGHCFDLNAKGYLHLAPGQGQPSAAYGAGLFQARAAVCDWGFFQPMADAVLRRLSALYAPDAAFTLLDAGCGEGYYAKAIARAFPNATVLGVDLSCDAVRLAAHGDSPARFAVADLKRLPLCDHCADVVLDVLTPADYSEFGRVLKPDGLLMKAVPDERHLQELRHAAGDALRTEAYSNAQVLALLQRRIDISDRESVLRTFDVPPEIAPSLLRMTPLTQRLDTASWPLPTRATLHMALLCGRCHAEE